MLGIWHIIQEFEVKNIISVKNYGCISAVRVLRLNFSFNTIIYGYISICAIEKRGRNSKSQIMPGSLEEPVLKVGNTKSREPQTYANGTEKFP